MRITDAWLALPGYVSRSSWPPSWGRACPTSSSSSPQSYWTRYRAHRRGEVLSVRERTTCAWPVRAKSTIMRRHILSQVINSAIVLGDPAARPAIIAEATLPSSATGVRRPAGVGVDAGRRQRGPDGRLLVADRAAGLLHHADGPFGDLLGDWLRLSSTHSSPAVTGPAPRASGASDNTYVSARGT